MDLSLEGKVALIAGSSRGIGFSIAKSLIREGARVTITGRTRSDVEKATEELAKEFGPERLRGTVGDLADPAEIDEALQVTSTLGNLELLVANVGTGKAPLGAIVKKEEWDDSFDMNLWASVRVVESSLPHLLKNSRPSIVLIGSIAGLEAIGAPIPYTAAKAALNAYTKALATELGPKGVRVNSVAPGNVLFPGGTWEQRLDENPALAEGVLSQVPLRRFGTVHEIADAVTFLLSERASFITGACLVVDGGQTRAFG